MNQINVLQPLILTSLSISEIRQIIQEELSAFHNAPPQIKEKIFIPDDTYIEDIQFSVRLYNGLKSWKKNTWGEIKSLTKEECLARRNFGIAMWSELQDIIINGDPNYTPPRQWP